MQLNPMKSHHTQFPISEILFYSANEITLRRQNECAHTKFCYFFSPYLLLYMHEKKPF